MENYLKEKGPFQKMFEDSDITVLPDDVSGGVYLVDCTALKNIDCTTNLRSLNFIGETNIDNIENADNLSRIVIDPKKTRTSLSGDIAPFSLILDEYDIQTLKELNVLEELIRQVSNKDFNLKLSQHIKSTISDKSRSYSVKKYLNSKLNIKLFLNDYSQEFANDKYSDVDIVNDLIIEDIKDYRKVEETRLAYLDRIKALFSFSK